MDKVINIYTVGKNEAIVYSGAELKKYLGMMLEGMHINLEERDKYDNLEKQSIWLGSFDNLSTETGIIGEKASKLVEDPELDDYIYINVKNSEGIISGINNRSVLLGVYRFLTEVGCRWVRPGAEGEYIPGCKLDDITAHIDERASYRHRGICIEGAVSYENVADIIDWAPKVGFNSYFIQFREAYTFFERWYSHKNNPALKPEEFTVNRAREYVDNAVKEIKKRGLLYHAVGHGWTCEPFGIPGLGWDNEEYNVSPDTKKYLALVDGKRELWKGVPLNTNLCYSNSEVREIIVKSIAEYLKSHGEIDVIHFWLADGSNNHCECDNCRKAYPSDFYIKMLNELDALLTKEGINTKVVFLIYVDLLWTPFKEKINNPDRFILMFAPISRTYSKEFSAEYNVTELPPYERNKTRLITKVEENIGFLKSWQKIFNGDSFDFDYHFMWDHYKDPGYYQIAEILGLDIKNLKNIGLNGYISCQTQRAFFPTGLGMYLMGKLLWNDKLSFDSITEDYFYSAFGNDGEKCREYLSKLSKLFDPPYIRNEKPQLNAEDTERFGQIAPLINNFMPVIEKNMRLDDNCHSKSWTYLKHHADISILYASILEAWSAGDKEKAAESLKNMLDMVQTREMDLQPVFDVWNFTGVMKGRFKI